MEITLEILKKVWKSATYFNLSNNEIFDYVNVTKTESQPLNSQNHLFFAIHEVNPSIEGWYIDIIDRRKHFPQITVDNPHWTFVVDNSFDIKINEKTKLIIVEDINNAIKELFLFVLDLIKPKVIAVTGSAGKTTTAALIETVVSLKFKCLRIFSKRITPLIIYNNIINNLNSNIEFVILEIGIYRVDHPFKLTELLKPDFAILINVLGMHIGVNGIRSVEQILEGKSKIIKEKSVVILNRDDIYLSKLISKKTYTFSLFEQEASAYIKSIYSSYIVLDCLGKSELIRPYIKTKLFVYQCLITLILSKILKIKDKIAVKAINQFIPKENRLNKYRFGKHLIYFSALITHKAYFDQMSDNFYEDSTLIILKVSFGEDNSDTIKPDLPNAFLRFSRVVVLKSEHNLNCLSDVTFPRNTFLREKEDLFKGVPNNSIIFMHYGKYFSEKKIQDVEIDTILSEL